MARMTLAILILGCCTCTVWSLNERLREVYSWKQLDFEFPDQKTRENAIRSGEYVQENNLALGLEVWRDKLFITVPRWKSGVASTLNYVSLGSGKRYNSSPRLVPYPSYEMNKLPTGGHSADHHIINLFRINVDKCDRLWLIDMGFSNGTSLGPPKLMVINLKTDKVIRKFIITPDLMRADGSTWFPGLLADVDPNSCDRAFAYLPDLSFGMVVYDFQHNTAKRIDHHYFYFDPLSTVFHIGGVRVEWMDGLFGVGLSERHPDGFKTLYFQSMASTSMFSVNTRVLQTNTTGTKTFDEYHHLGNRPARMQAGSMDVDEKSGTVFYSLVNQAAIGCWNPKEYDYMSAKSSAVLQQNPDTLEFPADIKVDKQSNLWVLSNRMPRFRFQVNRFDVDDVNYRVFSAPVADIIRDTVCESKTRPPFGPDGFQTPMLTTSTTGGSGWNTPSTNHRNSY